MKTFSHENYEKNLAAFLARASNPKKPYYGGDEYLCCAHCGKYVKTPRLFVYIVYGGTFEPAPLEEVDGHIGHWPVGSDCAKKLKSLGVPVYQGRTTTLA